MKNNSIQIFKQELYAPSMKQRIEERLGKKSGTFITSIIDLCSANEKLTQCEPRKVIAQALKAAALDLPINNNLGFAYVYPFGKEPTFVMGYKGYIQLAIRTGLYKHLNASAVYQGQMAQEDIIKGTLQIIGTKEKDEAIGYFSYMELINGFQKAIYWDKKRVVEHAIKYSKSYNFKDSAWKTDFNSMAKKTMILRLKTYMPMTIEMTNAFENDGSVPSETVVNDYDAENSETIDIVDVQENKSEEIFDGGQK